MSLVPKTLLLGFILSPNFSNLANSTLRCFRCSSSSLVKMIIPSMQAKTKFNPWNTWIYVSLQWFRRISNSKRHTYEFIRFTHDIVIVILNVSSSSAIGIWRYPLTRPIFEKNFFFLIFKFMSLIWGSGYLYGTLNTFRRLQSPQGLPDVQARPLMNEMVCKYRTWVKTQILLWQYYVCNWIRMPGWAWRMEMVR